METSSDVTEGTRRSSDDETFQPQDRLQSAQEQLAELRLLARADLHAPSASFTSPPDDISVSTSVLGEETDTQLNEGESRGVATGGLSSFTAILAASRKIATTSADYSAIPSNDLASANEIQVVPLDQAHGPNTIENPGRQQSPKAPGKSLPTLNEGAEGEEDEDDNDEIPETASILTSTTYADKLSSSSVEVVPVRQEQEPGEPDSDDFEFAEMLEHLSRGELDFLVITPEDLTTRKLKRVHTALSQAQTSTPTMPYVRALVSVDILRLLLQRLGVRAVRDVVTRTLQHANEREEESASGTDPSVLLTSSNIAAVVLEVRQELTTEASTVSPPLPPQLPRRTSPVTNSKHHVRRSSQTSSSSSRCSSSPSSSVSSSPRCGTPRSPAADRRSILAKEGVHVLMQEKLVSFDHRGQANALPAFRVRGVSAAITDSAAKRRQRGLQYANDHVTHRTVHM